MKHLKRFLSNKENAATGGIMAVLLLMPVFVSNPFMIHMGIIIGINILLALGMNLITGTAGQINMGQYGFYAVGAYTSAIISTELGAGFGLSLLAAIVVSIIFGLLVGIPSLRVQGPYLALCTIGFGESMRIVFNNAEWAGLAMGIPNIPRYSFFGHTVTSRVQSYYVVMLFTVIAILIVTNIMYSSYGRKLRCVKDDQLASSVVGLDVKRIKVFAFVICSVFAGVAGCLFAHYSRYISPTIFTQVLQINLLLMIVLGGLGKRLGAVVGAVLVTIIYELTRTYVQYQMVVFGAAMILTVLYLKKGIVGGIEANLESRRIRMQHNQR